ncbi:muramoyltetrapeptide carboxypeptidase LdcA involved in peptidoglycan recycling [Tumebacillus sp. BK434]|uniref:S66 family peptidase n=1 Tax=Tumebacillus sp. BK434 TaxID=2512169 RepID=UPI0010483C03|nr:S66 peptidase family protein [Tumebacillus sp. BK434]TCP59654.1 muramoyltetrapeptide carboxypeptidase LdcA involved in peptidoglycan recycling [Tumebacillus sp. BK434]
MSHNMRYPQPLQAGGRIAVNAPSSGITVDWKAYLEQARRNVEAAGYDVQISDTVWSNVQLTSASKEVRAEEMQRFLLDPNIQAVVPVWGGEFLFEILPLLDWERLKAADPKWVLGYSDLTTFCFVHTLLTGQATAHGNNFFDLGTTPWDALTRRWTDVLATPEGGQVRQMSSERYQKHWSRKQPSDPFALTEETAWKLLGREQQTQAEVEFSGRLLGGCWEILRSLVGTRYAPVQQFVRDYCREEGVIWYLESSEINAAEMYRSLWQMKDAGWFEGATGFLIGRARGNVDVSDFHYQDALHRALDDLQVPVIYEADVGHLPPQMILVNGAVARVSYQNGKGTLVMEYR